MIIWSQFFHFKYLWQIFVEFTKCTSLVTKLHKKVAKSHGTDVIGDVSLY